MKKSLIATTAALAMMAGPAMAQGFLNPSSDQGQGQTQSQNQTANGGAGVGIGVSVVNLPNLTGGPDQLNDNAITGDNSGQQVQIGVNGQNLSNQFDEQIDSPDDNINVGNLDEVNQSVMVGANQVNLLSPSLSQVKDIGKSARDLSASSIGNAAVGEASVSESGTGNVDIDVD